MQFNTSGHFYSNVGITPITLTNKLNLGRATSFLPGITSMCGAVLFAVSRSRVPTSTVRLDYLNKLQEYCMLMSADVSQQRN